MGRVQNNAVGTRGIDTLLAADEGVDPGRTLNLEPVPFNVQPQSNYLGTDSSVMAPRWKEIENGNAWRDAQRPTQEPSSSLYVQ